MNSAARQTAPTDDGRHQPRTHLFVAATLYADGDSAPVHIRNMSPSGALIEAPLLPDVGHRITLKRGQVHTTGHIAWRVDRRAGVRLDMPICVADWMLRRVSAAQDQVDAALSAIRSNTSIGPDAAAPASSIEVEILKLRSDLVQLGNSLIGDIVVAATHPEIQTIDISLQRIDRLLKRLRDGG